MSIEWMVCIDLGAGIVAYSTTMFVALSWVSYIIWIRFIMTGSVVY